MFEVIRTAMESIISTSIDQHILSKEGMWDILHKLEENHDSMNFRIDLSCGSVDMFCNGQCCKHKNSGYLNYDIREIAARIGL